MNETIRLTRPQVEKHDREVNVGLPAGRERSTYKFVYACYPRSWGWVEGHGFLPSLKKINAVPGGNGCDRHGSLAGTLQEIARRGGVVIDPKDQRLGKYRSYVRFFNLVDDDNRISGRCYVDWCQEASVLPSKDVLWNRDDTQAEFNAFRAHIRDAGIVPPLVREVYLQIRAKTERKISLAQGRAGQNPHLQAKIKVMEKNLAQMDKDWGAYQKDLAGEVKKVKPDLIDSVLEGSL